jgi:repressor LexA
MQMDQPTGRRAQILDFIGRYAERHGYPPTVREIGEGVGLSSPSTVHAHLAKLEAAGMLSRDATKPRAMQVAADAPPPRPNALPLLGAVAAGVPRLADEDVEDWVEAPFQADFLLRVRGDSMIGAGMLDGDILAIRRQSTVDNGEIGVALVGDEEATVKRIFREPGGLRLQPENDAYEAIITSDVRILGRVVGVMRGMGPGAWR